MGQKNTRAGEAVACIGDVNGDGVTDFALSVSYDGSDAGGNIFVFLMASTGLYKQMTSIGPTALGLNGVGTRLGAAMTGIGDLNRDGVPDLVVSSIGLDATRMHPEGALHVIFLKSSGGIQSFASYPGSTFGAVTGAMFGKAIAPAGDWDGEYAY